MATVHPPRAAPPPRFALLPRGSPHAGADVDDDSDSESVAESCPWPQHPRGGAADDSCGSSTCCHDEEMYDDDACSSCVQGDECRSYQCEELQEAAADEDEGGKPAARSGVWWERMAVAGAGDCGGGTFPLDATKEEDDPKRAAERQEEDRKFWEDCLATGYP